MSLSPLHTMGPRPKHKASGRKAGEYLWDLRVGKELYNFCFSKDPKYVGTDVGKVCGACVTEDLHA